MSQWWDCLNHNYVQFFVLVVAGRVAVTTCEEPEFFAIGQLWSDAKSALTSAGFECVMVSA